MSLILRVGRVCFFDPVLLLDQACRVLFSVRVPRGREGRSSLNSRKRAPNPPDLARCWRASDPNSCLAGHFLKRMVRGMRFAQVKEEPATRAGDTEQNVYPAPSADEIDGRPRRKKGNPTPPTIQPDGPPCMVKRPTGSDGEPSSPNCGASARIRLVNPLFSSTFIADFGQFLACGRIPSQVPCNPRGKYLHFAPSDRCGLQSEK